MLYIILPVHNRLANTIKFIDSLDRQSYRDFHLIVIVDGSTDGSVEIIKKYEKYLAYWVSEKDKGQADAINKGFKKVVGIFLLLGKFR